MLALFQSTAIDGTPSIPFVTILCMATAIIMMIVVPIFAMRYIKKNYHGKYKSMIYGIAMYCLFDLLIFNIVMIAWTNIKTIGENKLFMAILAAVISGLVAIVGRTIAIHALAGSKSVEDGGSFGNAYMSGIGYAILNFPGLIINMTMNLFIALMINLFGASYVAEEVGAEGAEALADAYEVYMTTPAYDFLISGIEAVLLLVISISTSVVIYTVYNKKGRPILLLIAAIINVLCMLPVYLNQYGIFVETKLSMILFMALFTAWIAFFASGIMKMILKDEIKEIKERDMAAVKQPAFPDFNKNIKKDF